MLFLKYPFGCLPLTDISASRLETLKWLVWPHPRWKMNIMQLACAQMDSSKNVLCCCHPLRKKLSSSSKKAMLRTGRNELGHTGFLYNGLSFSSTRLCLVYYTCFNGYLLRKWPIITFPTGKHKANMYIYRLLSRLKKAWVLQFAVATFWEAQIECANYF